jgi:hypothetical protein
MDITDLVQLLKKNGFPVRLRGRVQIVVGSEVCGSLVKSYWVTVLSQVCYIVTWAPRAYQIPHFDYLVQVCEQLAQLESVDELPPDVVSAHGLTLLDDAAMESLFEELGRIK